MKMDVTRVCVLLLSLSFGFGQEVIEVLDNYGIIESPGFPDSYPANQNITWVIKTQPGYVIEIDITDFYLEVSYDEEEGKCPYDFVTIASADEEEKFCGNRQSYASFAPNYKPYKSDTNEVIVNFVSDYSNDEEGLFGFRLYYSKIDADECEMIREGTLNPDLNWDEALYCNHHCVNFPGSYQCLCKPGFVLDDDQHTCKIQCENPTVLTAPNGTVSSPGYPGKYGKYSDCTWIIEAPENTTIEMNCDQTFQIEDHAEENDCPYDRLTMTYHDTPFIYCGTDAPYGGDTIYTDANKVSINFKSDRTVEYAGFSCNYTITEM